ncbi:helicase C-terminal domain-containing protein [Treponema pectinovorum]|uniref:helicase C-terminal domain-containing protein n=1 Tax=Treponema pectinovorum TaxID=164 RepID=UPI0011CB2B42|nr:helicase C-terminal domain-containing protein [Treponema pectinovorum]
MEINRRFSESIRLEIKNQIEDANGNEVFFAGYIDETGMIISVEALSRGNINSVPIHYSGARKSSVLIHNHPSGNLYPSDADLAFADDCAENAQGFYIINNEVTDVYVVMEAVLPAVVKKIDPEQASDYLSNSGSFAKKSKDYEERPSQLALVKKITLAFNDNKIGVFEAGTGVGKSFSYLIPSILWALENKERVVISTGTINLQQQLIEKDIPKAEEIVGKKLKTVLVKGRQNFVCLRRLEDVGKERDLFDEEQESFDRIFEWAKTTKTGSRTDLSFLPLENIWQKVNSESDACMGMKCPFREKCFVMKMRKEAIDANLLIVNHHLLFADIQTRLDSIGFEDSAVLPPYKRLIFDEAHGIEEAATSFFSIQLNRFRVQKQLNLMYRQRRNSVAGFLLTLLSLSMAEENADELMESVNKIKIALANLDEQSLNILENDYTLRVFDGTKLKFAKVFEAMSSLQKNLSDFVGTVRKLFDFIPEEDNESPVLYESRSVLRRLEDFSIFMHNFLSWDEHQDSVFWIQKSKLPSNSTKNDENPFYVQFIQTPLDIAPTMNRGVFENMSSVVCTSATLSIGNSFNYWKKRTGVFFADKQRLSEGDFPSPFPYEKNVLFAVTKDAPFPEDFISFQSYAEDAIVKLLKACGGRTLVLFTAYDSLRHACDSAKTAFKASGINILKQGDDDRFRLLNTFKEDESSVLFATDSFWEGVDVPGSSLSQVIIVKLPFLVPNNPVFAARSELILQRGGNPFMELSLPEAVIKFRQGFGRLMRRNSDRGVIVVLDRRIVEKHYGKIFTSSLPETKKMYDSIENIAKAVESFID